MNTTPIGDLSQILQSQARTAQAQADLNRLTGELSSGRKSDLGGSLRGNFSELSSIERGLKVTETYRLAAESAGSYFSAMQDLLQSMEDISGRASVDILATATRGQRTEIMTTLRSSEEALSASVSALNQRILGRSAFAGTATDQPALISADQILAELETALVGVPDSVSMIQIVDDWFMLPGGGYETGAYLGSDGAAPSYAIAEDEKVSSNITALDPGIRKQLSGLVLSALVAREIGPSDDASVSTLAEAAASRTIEGNEKIIELRSNIGIVEARIEQTITRYQASETALSIRRSDLVNADPFKTATELQAVESRLETLFLVTARLSRLSLAEYL